MKKKVFAKAIRNHIILLAAGAIAGLILLVLVHLLPIEPMREHVYWSMDMIEREFDNEILIDGYRSTLTGNFTDCLMLEHAVYSSEEHSLLEQVLHMYRGESCPPETAGQAGWWPGQSLKDYLTGVPQPREVSYSRYWHGYLVLLKPLLLLTSFNTIRLLQSAVQLILAGCVVMALCRKGAYPLAKAFLLSLPFLFFVSTYASLSLSICFYVMTAAALIQLKADGLLARRGWYGLFFMAVGMATVYFDFLTYPLVTLVYPLGIYLYFHGGTPGKGIRGMVGNSAEWGIGYGGDVGGQMDPGGLPYRKRFHPGCHGDSLRQDRQRGRLFPDKRLLQCAGEEPTALSQLVLSPHRDNVRRAAPRRGGKEEDRGHNAETAVCRSILSPGFISFCMALSDPEPFRAALAVYLPNPGRRRIRRGIRVLDAVAE